MQRLVNVAQEVREEYDGMALVARGLRGAERIIHDRAVDAPELTGELCVLAVLRPRVIALPVGRIDEVQPGRPRPRRLIAHVVGPRRQRLELAVHLRENAQQLGLSARREQRLCERGRGRVALGAPVGRDRVVQRRAAELGRRDGER